MIDETTLIDRVKRGDQRAFKDLYDRHAVTLFRFMRQYSDDTFQVEDWVQRAFIKSYRSIGTFQGASRFATWLFTIALNEMRTDVRKVNIVAFNSDEVKNWNGREEEDMSFVWEETMKSWLRDMDESKRTVFLLYEIEGYSHAEIASMLNIGASTSRALLCRAKQFLKTKLKSEEKTS